MGLALALEDFDDAIDVDGRGHAMAARSADWLDGHAAGRAEAEAVAAAEQATLSAALVQRLEDMSFGYAEARATILADLRPLFETLSSTLLPALGDSLLAAHLAQALLDAAAADLSGPVSLRVSVAEVVAVSDLLSGVAAVPFTCRADPALPVGSAIVSGANGAGQPRESNIDIINLTDGLRKILSAFAAEHSQETAHG